MEFSLKDINEMMKPPRRRSKKIKSPTDEPDSGNDRSYVIIRMEDGTLEKHYRKVTKEDSGFYTTTAKYAPTKTARWVGGKSRNNPKFMPGSESVVAYFRATLTTTGHKTSEDLLMDDLRKNGFLD